MNGSLFNDEEPFFDSANDRSMADTVEKLTLEPTLLSPPITVVLFFFVFNLNALAKYGC